MAETMLREADAALYRAQRSGRNRLMGAGAGTGEAGLVTPLPA